MCRISATHTNAVSDAAGVSSRGPPYWGANPYLFVQLWRGRRQIALPGMSTEREPALLASLCSPFEDDRMPGRNFLFVPGPTNVPERILRAMDRAMEDHRSSAFPTLTAALLLDLKKVFRTTTGQAFIFPATGTGGWEAALVNTLSPGDRVLAPRYGQFSHLWIDLAQRHGLRVDIIDVEWGEGAPVERIEEILSADTGHEVKGVLIVHNETATGVTSDVAAVRRALDAARHPALLYVDGVSSAVRAWGLKLCARAPQWHSDTVSAILVPDGFDAAAVIDVAFRRYNLALGAGLARLAGKLFRIGHLGDLNELMLLGAIAGTEMAMRDVGIKVTPGSGGAAAAEHYRSTAAPLPPRPAAPPATDAVQTPAARSSPRTAVRA